MTPRPFNPDTAPQIMLRGQGRSAMDMNKINAAHRNWGN